MAKLFATGRGLSSRRLVRTGVGPNRPSIAPIGRSHPFQFARVTGRTARVLKIFQFAESANPASVRGFSKTRENFEDCRNFGDCRRDGGISARPVICAWSFLVSGSPQHRWGHRIPLICNQRFSNYGIPRNKSKVKLERLRSLLESIRRARPIRVASLSVPQRFSADMRNRRKWQANRAMCYLDIPNRRDYWASRATFANGRVCSGLAIEKDGLISQRSHEFTECLERDSRPLREESLLQ